MPFSERIRVLYDMSRSMKFMNKTFHGISYDQIEQKCFFVLQQEIFKASSVNRVHQYHIAKDEVKVSLPVRVNWRRRLDRYPSLHATKKGELY